MDAVMVAMTGGGVPGTADISTVHVLMLDEDEAAQIKLEQMDHAECEYTAPHSPTSNLL